MGEATLKASGEGLVVVWGEAEERGEEARPRRILMGREDGQARRLVQPSKV
jgi:hypothetical protein